MGQYLQTGILCADTGLRFPVDQTDRYTAHRDWVYKKNKQETQTTRAWFIPQGDWVQYHELDRYEPKRKRTRKTKTQKDANDSVIVIDDEDDTPKKQQQQKKASRGTRNPPKLI